MRVKSVSQRFLDSEQDIYNEFLRKAEIARIQGFLPDPVLTQRVGGLTVAARHPRLVGRLTSVATAIRRFMPCCAYDGSSEHATFCCRTWDNFRYEQAQHESVLNDLSEAVAAVLKGLSVGQIRESAVNYRSPIFNRTTVILPGAPTIAYVDLLLTLTEKCQEKVGEIKPKWGTHITAARFQRVVEAAQAKEFLSFMEFAPALDNTELECVEVAWVETGSSCFRYKTHRSFVLGPDGFETR